VCAYLWRSTLPYVTDIMSTSSSSGEAVIASNIAITSSTPIRLELAMEIDFEAFATGHAWVRVNDNTVLGCHGG
jgi:hypothetical protein